MEKSMATLTEVLRMKYLLGTWALGMTLSLMGCEIGKNSTRVQLVGYDVTSGYYRTSPQGLNLSYTINGTSGSQPAHIQNIPADMREIMSDPMLLLVEDPVAGTASLRNSEDTGIGVAGIRIDQKAGKVGKSASGYATFKNCLLEQEITYAGDILQLSPQTFNGFKIRGQLSFDYQLKYQITGVEQDCTEWLTNMKNCYADASVCETTSNTIVLEGFVHGLFDPYINANAFSVNAIPGVRNLQVDISYR